MAQEVVEVLPSPLLGLGTVDSVQNRWNLVRSSPLLPLHSLMIWYDDRRRTIIILPRIDSSTGRRI